MREQMVLNRKLSGLTVRNIQEYPIYQIDNEDVTKEEFEKQLKEYVLDEQLDRSDWTILI